MTAMKRYSVGIDLGTSNTVLAYAAAGDPAAGDPEAGGHATAAPEIHVFEIEQLVSLGEVAARPLLPSVRYHAAPGELSAGDLLLNNVLISDRDLIPGWSARQKQSRNARCIEGQEWLYVAPCFLIMGALQLALLSSRPLER